MSGLIIEPEIVAEQKKQKERQHQLERRGIARDLLCAMIGWEGRYDHLQGVNMVDFSIMLADELLAKTKVE